MPSFSFARFSLSLDISKDKSQAKHSGKPRPVSYVEKSPTVEESQARQSGKARPVSYIEKSPAGDSKPGLSSIQEEEVKRPRHFLSPWRGGGRKGADKEGVKNPHGKRQFGVRKSPPLSPDCISPTPLFPGQKLGRGSRRPVSYHGDTELSYAATLVSPETADSAGESLGSVEDRGDSMLTEGGRGDVLSNDKVCIGLNQNNDHRDGAVCTRLKPGIEETRITPGSPASPPPHRNTLSKVMTTHPTTSCFCVPLYLQCLSFSCCELL